MDERAARGHLYNLGVGPVTRQRDWLNAPCPLAPWNHRSGRDSNPSFGVHVGSGQQSHYYCFTCKASGRIHDLAADLGRLRGEDYSHVQRQAFRDDIVSISDYDYEPEHVVLGDPLDDAVYGDLYEPVTLFREAMSYLADRGVNQGAARRLSLGYDPDDSRIVFPVRDRRNRLFGFTGRSILHPNDYPSQGYPKVKDYMGLPKRHLLLGEERVQAGKPIIVVEGLFAYARLVSIGTEQYASVVALLGSEMTDQKAERLQRMNEAVFLLVDNDEAGDVCLWGVKDRSGTHDGKGAVWKLDDHVPLYVPEYPSNCDDVDEFEIADIQHLISETQPYKSS